MRPPCGTLYPAAVLSNTLCGTEYGEAGESRRLKVRGNKLAPLLAVIGGAIVLVGAIVVASQLSHKSSKSSTIQTDSIAEMLQGIPQKGIELGNPNAKVVLSEISDPQCPYCADWAKDVLPTLVQNYVRTGKLRIEYQGLSFLDDNNPSGTAKDSDRLLNLAQAAGLQNKLWNVVELEFENQGTENTGFATDDFLKGIAEAVPGLNADKAIAASNTNAVVGPINAATAFMTANFISLKKVMTPSFVIKRNGAAKGVKIIGAQPLATFTDAIDAQLKK